MTHRFDLRVYYEDTDMAGVVYYANYLRYIERARSDWVRMIGLDQNAMRVDDGIVFVVHRVNAEYRAPAHFEDDLRIETDVTRVTAARLVMDQRVYRADTLLFRAEVTAALMTLDGKPVRMFDSIRKLDPAAAS